MKLSSNSLKITQNIKVEKSFSYMKHKENGKMLFGTKLFPVLSQFLRIPLLHFHLPFPCSTLQFSKETDVL